MAPRPVPAPAPAADAAGPDPDRGGDAPGGGRRGFVILKKPASTATQHNENRAEKHRDTVNAFSGGPAGAEDNAAIQATMDRLVAAVTANDTAALAALIDGPRMGDEIEAQGLAGQMSRRDREQFAKGVPAQLAGAFATNPAMKYSRIEVRRTKTNPAGDEAVVYLRCYGGLGDAGGKLRMWMKRGGDGAWKMYDWEDLDSSIRISDFVAMALAGSAGGGPPPWLVQAQNFQTLVQACCRRTSRWPRGRSRGWRAPSSPRSSRPCAS